MPNQHTDALFTVTMGDTCLLKGKNGGEISDTKVLAECIDRDYTTRGNNDTIEEYAWTFEIPKDVRSEYELRGELINVRIRYFEHKDVTYYYPAYVINSDDRTAVESELYFTSLEIVDE